MALRFENLLEAVPDALVGMDQKGMIRFVNRQTESLFGYDRDQLIGQHIDMLVPDTLWQIYAQHQKDYFADSRTRSSGLDLDVSGRHHNGGEFPIHVSMSSIDTGDVLLVIAGVGDVASQQRAVRKAGLAEAIMEYSDDAIISATLDGTITSWNPAAEKMYGYSASEIIGRSGQLLIPRDQPDQMNQLLVGLKTGHHVEHLETTRVRKDGTVVPVSVNGAPIYDEDGTIVGVSAAHRDVTQQRQASEAAEHLAAIVQFSGDAIYSRTVDGIITSWNPAAERMYGYSSNEIVGKPITLLIPEDRKGEIEATLAKIGAGQPIECLETIRVRRDGTVLPVSLTVSPINAADGSVVGASVISRDLTERKRALEISQRLTSIVEDSQDAIISGSLDGKVTSWNPAAERLFGYSSKDAVGKTASRLVPQDRSGEVKETLDKIKAGQHVREFETMRVRKDGTVFPISLTVSPLRDADGVIIGTSVIYRDLTAQKRAERAVEQERDLLRTTMDSLMDPHVLLEAVRDEAGKIVDFAYVDANPAACAYLGTDYERLVGARLLDVQPGSVGSGLLDRYVRVVETGEPLLLDDIVYAQELRGGQERHYDVRAARAGRGLSYSWRDVTDRHEAAARLAESQEQYRLLAENASDVVYRAGPDRRIVWIAPSVSAVLGWDPEELVGTEFADLLRPDYKIAIEQARAEFYDKGRDVNPKGGYLFELRTKSGDYRWMSGRAHALTDPGGTPAGMVAGLRDVDDLVRARQEAQKGEAVLRATRDSLMDPHLLLDAVRDESGQIVDFRFVDANPAACAYFDMAYPDLIGKRLLDLFPGHVESGLFELYVQVVDIGEPVILDDFLYRQELLQAERRYDIRAAVVGDGLCVSWRDVTERHEAVEYASWMAAVVDQTHDAIIGVSLPDALVTSWNPAAERMYGYTTEEILGKAVFILAPEDKLEQAKKLLAQLSAGEAVTDVETVRIRKDGSRIPVSMSSSPIRGANGVTVRLSTIHRDITKEKAAREEAQALTSALKTSNDSLRDFVAVASHDLRSPLVTIGGFAKILTDNWATLSDEARLKELGAIQRGVVRLSRLTDDLLTSAKVEAEAEPTHPEHVRLATALASYLEANREQLGAVAVTCAPELVALVDPSHLARILDNYLTNAFKYGEPPICIEAERVGDFIELRVLDHGPGVPPELVPRLFTKFDRGDTQDTRAAQGTGLGLSIVKGLAEANHGDVRYQHDEPTGGCFVVRLPAGTD